MRILVVGSGAREHAIAWALQRSPSVSKLYVLPGNAGTREIAHNLSNVKPLDIDEILTVCQTQKIDLSVIGPEAPLAAGLVDRLTAAGIAAFGASQAASQLEASKAFAKEFMARHGIPTAAYRHFEDRLQAEEMLRNSKHRLVVKRDGLADGKGVLDSTDIDALVAFATTGLATGPIVIEEHLQGPELSAFVLLTGGQDYLLLPYCADYKKQDEGERGLNTGGMGSISPVPWVSNELDQRIQSDIISPTVNGLVKEDLSYRGVLYIGLMATPDGPKVIEYNVRFGDPETQALLPTLDVDMGHLFQEISAGRKPNLPAQHGTAVVVVVASNGYPEQYATGLAVQLPVTTQKHGLIFHASTQLQNKQILTGGGRCFSAVGLGQDLKISAAHAYELARQIRFKGSWYRRDIAAHYR